MPEPEALWFVYDGQCPLCQMGARHIRIREAVGQMHLLDARTAGDHALMREIAARGLDLDKGMVVTWGGHFYHGAEALHMLALLGTDADWLNRLNARLFKSRALSRLCYPLLKGGRRLALWAKGVPPL